MEIFTGILIVILIFGSCAAILVWCAISDKKDQLKKLNENIRKSEEEYQYQKQTEDQEKQHEENKNSDSQYKASKDNMNRCKICGQPCGIYEICRECQKDIAEGKVSMCTLCGKYYFTAVGCKCNSHKEEQYQTQKKENTTTQEREPTPFKDGVNKGFGTGCGCFVAIGIVILILVIIAVAGIDGVMDTLGIK